MTKIGAHLTVKGRVQGVGFRFTTQMKAKEIGVNGWVKNLSDGSVEMKVEGKKEPVYQFIDLVKAGPSPSAHVENVDISLYEDLQNYNDFEIVY